MKIFITGITGFIGSYLAEFLIEKGYDDIHGTIRRKSEDISTLLKKNFAFMNAT